MTRYVIVSVDPADKTIHDGPILWDGLTVLTLAPGLAAITEQAARTGGYTPAPTPIGQANTAALQSRAAGALTANAAYLAISAPTTLQVVAQVNRLTRETTAIIRLLLQETDDVSGT